MSHQKGSSLSYIRPWTCPLCLSSFRGPCTQIKKWHTDESAWLLVCFCWLCTHTVGIYFVQVSCWSSRMKKSRTTQGMQVISDSLKTGKKEESEGESTSRETSSRSSLRDGKKRLGYRICTRIEKGESTVNATAKRQDPWKRLVCFQDSLKGISRGRGRRIICMFSSSFILILDLLSRRDIRVWFENNDEEQGDSETDDEKWWWSRRRRGNLLFNYFDIRGKDCFGLCIVFWKHEGLCSTQVFLSFLLTRRGSIAFMTRSSSWSLHHPSCPKFLLSFDCKEGSWLTQLDCSWNANMICLKCTVEGAVSPQVCCLITAQFKSVMRE